MHAYNTYRVYISSLAGLFNFVLFTRAYVRAMCAGADVADAARRAHFINVSNG